MSTRLCYSRLTKKIEISTRFPSADRSDTLQALHLKDETKLGVEKDAPTTSESSFPRPLNSTASITGRFHLMRDWLLTVYPLCSFDVKSGVFRRPFDKESHMRL